jgi:hypothetical protein
MRQALMRAESTIRRIQCVTDGVGSPPTTTGAATAMTTVTVTAATVIAVIDADHLT